MERETDGDMIQSAVRLPRSLHERLKKAGGKRGMGEEIRRRLEASFDAEAKTPHEPMTRELLGAITFLAGQTTNYLGSWSEDAFAFKVLEGSLDMLLKRYQPKGDPLLAKPNLTKLGEAIFGKNSENENHSPEEISRTLVRFWIVTKAIVGAERG
jgi:hypothetical protein